MRDLGVLALVLHTRRRRMAVLAAFAAIFLLAAIAARATTGHDGHVEFDRLFELGGYPLVSGMLLIGWILGRFPIAATLVLLAGVYSADRASGDARLFYARPTSAVRQYLLRAGMLALCAFVISALLMPLFDTIMLGAWAGPATLVLIASYVLLFGSLTLLLSTITRADAWLALLLGLLAMVWHALRRADVLAGTPPGVREVVTTILPPHGALLAIEQAFAQMLPIPWNAFLFVVLYSALLVVIAGIVIARREV